MAVQPTLLSIVLSPEKQCQNFWINLQQLGGFFVSKSTVSFFDMCPIKSYTIGRFVMSLTFPQGDVDEL